MRKTRILLAVITASLVLVLLTGSAVAQDASIDTEAQTTEDGTVTINSAEIDQDGWVAVYGESVTGGPNFDDMVGATELDEGSHSDIEVETDIEEHGFYYAVLHYDESADSEFDYPDDPVVEVNETDVQDYMFVAVGTGDEYEAYADANQQRRDLQNQLESLRQEVDELEDRGGDDYEDEIESLRDEIDTIEQDIEDLDSVIQDREELLQQLEEAEEQAEGDDDDGEMGDGNTTDDGEDGGTTDGGDGDGGSSEEPEGLPGFTTVAALVALLTGGALLRRD